ncbi:MAG TPA: MucB/RseB C-terminal domain-containing protein, partial [Burkholderiaceae bacterium]|nr:MucB/RseB C-terminal domain-containing protein [Burkholderiaceae bacterium]
SGESRMNLLHFSRTTLGVGTLSAVLGCALPPTALALDSTRAPAQATHDMSMQQWLERLHEASRRRAYTGTFVVSDGVEIAASKIWHVCDGTQQVERIETLTGTPRITLRRNDEVMTFAPDLRLVRKEKREALRLFPDLLKAPGQHIEALYGARTQGMERVAGFDAVVVDFVPKDGLRYAYRVWSEKKTGLVVKLQTRDAIGQVVEQVAFTELQLDAPVRAEVLARQMENTKDYQVIRPVLRKTTPEAEGWRLKTAVPGFQSMSCQTRSEAESRQAPVVQWVFSDGLASVSLFLETFDPQRHTKEGSGSAGATHTLMRRLGDHWVTALGEVPVETLNRFVLALERTR